MPLSKQKRLNLIDDYLEADDWASAANLCLITPVEGLTKQDASGMLWHVARSFLDKGDYLSASKIIIGRHKFHVDAYLSRVVWDAMPKYSELLIMGGTSVGKTFTAGGWMFLDYLRDPDYTAIKVLSLTAEHAKKNVFGTIKNYFTSTRFKYDQKVTAERIGGDDERSGIQLTTIPIGAEGKGRLRGFHPIPRGKPHPIFGPLSRIRVLCDEIEEVPDGIWPDLNNLLAGKYNAEQLKVVGATNPQDINSAFAKYAEPVGGWSKFDIETWEQWTSKLGWRVLRLDGFSCENVQQKKIIYPGMISWEGYQRYLAMGDKSSQYYTMARGAFPEQGVHTNAIPPNLFERGKGQILFVGKTAPCASFDLAFEGGDSVVMTNGKFGLAYGWMTFEGAIHRFETQKYCLQIDRVCAIPKKDSLFLAKDIKERCDVLGVKPEWLILDRTGNGTGVNDILKNIFGSHVLGLHYAQESTDKKIMDDDSEKASDLYDTAVTELFFGMARWLEFDYVKFSKEVEFHPLQQELTNRQVKKGSGKKVKIESKKEYKARGFDSPDYADSATMLVYLCRMNMENAAVMIEAPTSDRPKVLLTQTHYEKGAFLNFNDDM